MDPRKARLRAEADPDGPAARTRDLANDVVQIRDDLDRLLGELERRRHDLTDVRLQVRRHAGSVAMTGASVVLVLAGSMALARWRARRRQKLMPRLGLLRAALGRAIARPDLVARPSPTIGKRLLSAVLTTAATVAVRKLAERAIRSPRTHTA